MFHIGWNEHIINYTNKEKMGIQANGMKLIHQVVDNFEGEYNVMNWGNAYIRTGTQKWIFDNGKIPVGTTLPAYAGNGSWASRDYFPLVGGNHKSIDMNGKEGSLVIDLRLAIEGDDEHGVLDWADLIIDAGTSEHVAVQYYNWKNLYDVCRVGGYMVHILPKVGYWAGHCEFKYTSDFFTQLSDAMGYEIIELYDDIENESRGDVCCIFKKVSDIPFMSTSEFAKLPIHTEKGLFRDRGLYSYAYN